MLHSHWLSITHHDSQPLAQHSSHHCYAEPMVVNHGLLSWASGCESCCVMLSQWLWITMCYSKPVVMNHGVLFWASGCESCCVVLSQWLWITVIMLSQGFESWCVILNQWLFHNHWFGIAHHDSQPLVQHNHRDSQPLAQNNTTWFTTTGLTIAHHDSVMLSQWLWITMCYSKPVVMNHGVLFWASGCESCCVVLSQWLWITLAQNNTTWFTITGSE
jgi:hypothetical protein